MNAVLVDDEKMGLDYLTCLCENISELTNIKGFVKAREALRWCESNPADLLLLDVNMPDINGIDLAKKVKKINPSIKIIFVSAYGKYAIDAFGLHADGYLLKPVNQNVLTEEIRHVLSDN